MDFSGPMIPALMMYFGRKSDCLSPLRCPRIAVVAASHFGLDNIARAVLAESGGRVIPFRFVPPYNLDRLRSDKVIDTDLHDATRRHYDATALRCQALGDATKMIS